jgi:hypothetical protein
MGEDRFAEGTVERREGMKFQMKHGKKKIQLEMTHLPLLLR